MRILLIMAISLIISLQLSDATRIIVAEADGDFSSIQGAVNFAHPGDIIEVESGVYRENVIVNKMLILEGSNKPTVDACGKGSTILLQADGVILNGFTIIGSRNQAGHMDAGIKSLSDNIAISNNTITGNVNGIILEGSNDSSIKNNEIYGNRERGIYLHRSMRNLLERNNVTHNVPNHDSTGIYLDIGSADNSIRDNEVHGNGLDGIMISSSDNNTIRHNNVSENGEGGIHLNCGSVNTTVIMNNATRNRFGIYLTAAMSSWIYLNNFEDNGENARSWSSKNFWSSNRAMNYAYNFEMFANYTGNHWSDYSGNDVNGDGIGEESYPIGPDAIQYAIPGSTSALIQQQAALMAIHPNFADMDEYPLIARYESFKPIIAAMGTSR